MARLVNLVGDGNAGSPQLIDTYRPDAIRMERFRLAQEAVGGRKKKPIVPVDKPVDKNFSAPRMAKPANGFRLLRPSVPARVELRDGLPARVFFQGASGEIVAASGPWRTSGEWWQDPWDQAEWDVEVHFSSGAQKNKRSSNSSSNSSLNPGSERGLYLIYYDLRQQEWFLRGMYD
jgi:protein ImuB